MARTITLQNLIARVRTQGDTDGLEARHTDQRITDFLNQSQQAFRLLISESGDSYYLGFEQGTLTAGDATLAPSATDIVAILGLDVSVNGEQRELFTFSLADRNKYQDTLGDSDGVPTYYRPIGPEILLMPTPDAAYVYTLWYLPTGDDFEGTFDGNGALTASASTFDGIAGWEDWLVLDTCLRMSARDANTNDNYELLQAEFARVEKRVVANARKRTRTGPRRRLDTRGRRLCLETVNRWRLP